MGDGEALRGRAVAGAGGCSLTGPTPARRGASREHRQRARRRLYGHKRRREPEARAAAGGAKEAAGGAGGDAVKRPLFFLGVHKPSMAAKVERAMLSVN